MLHNRPAKMVPHIMKRWETDMADDMVKMVFPGVFNVDSSTGGYQYTVIFGNEQAFPNCT